MARFSTRETSQLREIEAALATVTEGGPSAVTWLLPAVRGLLGADKALAGAYRERGDGLGLAFGHVDRIDPGMIPFFDEWLAGKRIGFTGYNPVRPEPSQRNVALDSAEIWAAARPTATPAIHAELYARYGLVSDDSLRVLVCEGPSLLAWVGVFQSGAIVPRQKRLLARLIQPMRRRLSVERLLSTAAGTSSMLLAALEEISAPTFVTDAQGTVLEANTVGVEWLATDAPTKRRALRDAVHARGLARARFRVTRVASAGVAVRFLVVCRQAASPDPCRAAARDWRLSPRETQTLSLLAQGLTTRSIAAHLGISERTVGMHLTSMFEKAQVESRAELVVRALRRSLG